MATPWSFGRIAPPLLANPGQNNPTSSHESTSSRSKFQAMSSTICVTSEKRLTLLGMASEVRDEIWQTIFNNITDSTRSSGWAQRPTNEYGGLSLTCHQIREEIAFFWPRTIIQHRRIKTFTFTQPTVAALQDFKRLTLETPINQNYQFFLAAAASLKHLAPVLQDLRIFFVGSDKFQVPLSLAACGIHDFDISLISKRLSIDGQNHSIRQPLFVALRSLLNLRSLVLSNHNYPILPKMVLEYKPRLKQLHLETDARTTVHREYDLGAHGLNQFMIRPIQHGFPPVEILAMSANASLNSVQLAAACTLSLRQLTWTVPDLALQSAGGILVNWYRDTASLLRVLRCNSKQLHTLRMCFHEAIYEADPAAGTLIPAFRFNLEHLPLEVLELHINIQSPWFGGEILQYLPNSLRRLYLSRELLDEQSLSTKIDNRYMSCQETSDGNTSSRFLKRLQGAVQEDYLPVGEDSRRKDFISLGGGKLGFIGYEYEPTKAVRFSNSEIRKVKAKDSKAWMLTLNGRLLDRERNAHLLGCDGAKPIPPREYPAISLPNLAVQKFSIADKYGPMWVNAPPNIKEKEIAGSEFEHSVLAKRVHHYFGNEEEAESIFQGEQCAHPDDLQERRWTDVVSVHPDDHWQTDLPTEMRSQGVIGDVKAERHAVKKTGDFGQSSWEEERTAHWVRTWTWYPCDHSYVKEEERERFLAERSGESLECLEFTIVRREAERCNARGRKQ